MIKNQIKLGSRKTVNFPQNGWQSKRVLSFLLLYTQKGQKHIDIHILMAVQIVFDGCTYCVIKCERVYLPRIALTLRVTPCTNTFTPTRLYPFWFRYKWYWEGGQETLPNLSGRSRGAAKFNVEARKTIKKSLSVEISKRTTLLHKFYSISRSATEPDQNTIVYIVGE